MLRDSFIIFSIVINNMLEKLVAVLDGEIVSLCASDPIGGKEGDVNIRYSLPEHLSGVTRMDLFPAQALRFNDIIIQEGTKVKLAIFDDSHRTTLAVLKKGEYERFNNEPILSSDRISQKLSVYRFLTGNEYNL